jgi:hypothetical protein
MKKEKGIPCYCHLNDGHGTFLQISRPNKEINISFIRYNVNKLLFLKMAFGILFKKKPLTLSLSVNKDLKASIIKSLTDTTWYV